MATGPSLNVLQGYLKLVTERQQMIVSNMANVDTPGYHTKDIDFQSCDAASDERQRRSCAPGTGVPGIAGIAGASRRKQREHRPREPDAFADTTPVSTRRAVGERLNSAIC
jgi:flagellar basal body rod protein FlgG